MQQWYKLNFHKWFEKMDFLFASLHFAHIINTEGLVCLSIHLPTSCNRNWFLTIILILVSPWQEFPNCGFWVRAIRKVPDQPWKTPEVFFPSLCPWLSGSSITHEFIGSVINPLFPPKTYCHFDGLNVCP